MSEPTVQTAAAPAPTAPKVSFFHRLEQNVESFFKRTPALTIRISSTLKYTTPFVEEALVLINPAAAAVADPIIDRIQTGFGALAATISGSGDLTGSTAVNIKNIAASITDNLSSLEAVAGIKDPATQAKFTGLANLINGELGAISGSV